MKDLPGEILFLKSSDYLFCFCRNCVTHLAASHKHITDTYRTALIHNDEDIKLSLEKRGHRSDCENRSCTLRHFHFSI